jgi:ribosomal protein L32
MFPVTRNYAYWRIQKMTLSWFGLIWLLVAVGCLVVGALLSVRRKDQDEKSAPAVVRCRRCGEVLEPDARFCGVCGKYRSGKDRLRTIKIQSGKRGQR